MQFYIRKERGEGMTKRKRLISVFLAFSVIFVILFSAVYIASESNHECTDGECIVCLHINMCKNAFTVFKFIIASVFIFKAMFRLVSSISENIASAFKANTLVSLKVKLSD